MAFALLFGIPMVAAAQEPARVAVINMTEVFKAHPHTQLAEADLKQKRAAAGKDFNAKADELKGILEKHQEITAGTECRNRYFERCGPNGELIAGSQKHHVPNGLGGK